MYAPCQWETTLQCNVVSHWLDTQNDPHIYHQTLVGQRVYLQLVQFCVISLSVSICISHTFPMLYKITLNTLRQRQNWHHFADIFRCKKCIFLNENVWILLKISLKFVPKVRINNIPALVQIMVWRHYLNQWWLFYWCIYAVMHHSVSMS